MDVKLLEDIGLTNTQARAYIQLVEKGTSTAPALAPFIGESRSNAYKVLDRLCELGLATKDQSKRLQYYPSSPAALERLIEAQSEQVRVRTRKLDAALPNMLDFFFAHSEQASIRYFQGKQGLYEIFLDQTRSRTPVYFVRSTKGIRYFGDEEAHRLRNLFPANNVERFGIVQDIEPPNAVPGQRTPITESDVHMKLHRTWITTDDYDEPVEWAAYEDKLAITSFGEEVMGIVIQSPQIAQAFRKLYTLLSDSIRKRPDYDSLPKLATYTRTPTIVSLEKNLKNKRHQA